ncbi:MAG: BtpA/SgcQ family protein [Nitrospinota bacterium]|nr:BtpA/SgcQ family protein [Nitrospinota bacterium]
MDLKPLFRADRPLIGMVHLGPLPGSPRFQADWEETLEIALADAKAISDGGMHGLVIENFNDAPYFPDRVPPATIAAMTEAGRRIRRAVDIPLGINVLRNDARAALAVAYAAEAAFIRINVFVGARLTDQGLIQATAYEVQRERRRYLPDLAIFADVAVKHSSPIGTSSLANEASDAASRGFADALIVSGGETGAAASCDDLTLVKGKVPSLPVLIGSGVTPTNAEALLSSADGAIIGTGIKREGRTENPVDVNYVREFVNVLK